MLLYSFKCNCLCTAVVPSDIGAIWWSHLGYRPLVWQRWTSPVNHKIIKIVYNLIIFIQPFNPYTRWNNVDVLTHYRPLCANALKKNITPQNKLSSCFLLTTICLKTTWHLGAEHIGRKARLRVYRYDRPRHPCSASEAMLPNLAFVLLFPPSLRSQRWQKKPTINTLTLPQLVDIDSRCIFDTKHQTQLEINRAGGSASPWQCGNIVVSVTAGQTRRCIAEGLGRGGASSWGHSVGPDGII